MKASRTNTGALKTSVAGAVDAQQTKLKKLALNIHANPEVAFHEEKAATWLSGYLEETRYEVVEAADGADALERVRAARPVALFLDLDMPGLRGEEVLRRVREDPRTAALPVIVYTGTELDAGARARLAGATALVRKDVPRSAALRTLRDAMARAAARESPGEAP